MNPIPTPTPTSAAISRTSSAMSFSSTSEDDASLPAPPAVTIINSSRRTRKRFTNVQLTMLENLFHQNSHPSREEREAVAKAGGMEIKSVTIWFQNKRQTERKTAASNNGQANTFNEANVQPNITSTIHTFSLHNDTHISSGRCTTGVYSIHNHTHQYYQYHQHQASSVASSTSSSSSRPSLDRVASRTELQNAPPRTPSRRITTHSGQIYDSMPSSPLAPPISPSRDFIDFGKNAKTRRTLEWACAAARLADKEPNTGSGVNHDIAGNRSYHSASAEAIAVHDHHMAGCCPTQALCGAGSAFVRQFSSRQPSSKRLSRSSSSMTLRGERSTSSASTSRTDHMDVDGTDSEEDHEAITPPSTWGKGDVRWTTSPASSSASREGSGIMSLTSAAAAAAAGEAALPKGVDDDAMFKAALALCGLGRRV